MRRQRVGLDADEGEGAGGEPRPGPADVKRGLVPRAFAAIGQGRHSAGKVELPHGVFVQRRELVDGFRADREIVADGHRDGAAVLRRAHDFEAGKLDRLLGPIVQPTPRGSAGAEADAALLAGSHALRQRDVKAGRFVRGLAALILQRPAVAARDLDHLPLGRGREIEVEQPLLVGRERQGPPDLLLSLIQGQHQARREPSADGRTGETGRQPPRRLRGVIGRDGFQWRCARLSGGHVAPDKACRASTYRSAPNPTSPGDSTFSRRSANRPSTATCPTTSSGSKAGIDQESSRVGPLAAIGADPQGRQIQHHRFGRRLA